MVVIVWAALGDRRWALPIGVLLAMPVIWWGSFAILSRVRRAAQRDVIEARLFRLPSATPPGAVPEVVLPGAPTS